MTCDHSFSSSIWVGLPLYAASVGRHAMAVECVAAEALYALAVAQLWAHNNAATLWVLVLPFAVSSLALSFGNWCERAVLDMRQCHNHTPGASTCLSTLRLRAATTT